MSNKAGCPIDRETHLVSSWRLRGLVDQVREIAQKTERLNIQFGELAETLLALLEECRSVAPKLSKRVSKRPSKWRGSHDA